MKLMKEGKIKAVKMNNFAYDTCLEVILGF